MTNLVKVSYVQDMVAFSCCVFDGGKQEREDMEAARERGWKGKFTKPGLIIRPEFNRINGRCPLTPLEVIVSLNLFILIVNEYNTGLESCRSGKFIFASLVSSKEVASSS